MIKFMTASRDFVDDSSTNFLCSRTWGLLDSPPKNILEFRNRINDVVLNERVAPYLPFEYNKYEMYCSEYFECVDYGYSFEFEESFFPKESMDLDPEVYDDNHERRHIMNELHGKFSLFDYDRNTRQIVIRPDYIEDGEIIDGKPACISLLQFMIRGRHAIIFVHMRSQHIDNFVYDNVTFYLLYRILASRFNLNSGFLKVNIASLHKSTPIINESE